MGRLADVRIVDPVLTELARGYTNAEMVADGVFPRVDVDKETGKIPQFGKEAFKEYNTERAPRAKSNALPVDPRSTIPISLTEHDLYYPVDKREEAEAALSEQTTGLKIVQNVIALKREIKAAALAFTASNYASTNKVTLSGTTQFSHASSLPISVVRTAKNAVRGQIGRYPNTMLMGASVFETLQDHESLVGRIKYSMKGVLTIELMKEIFGVQNIFVGSAVKSSDAGVFSDVWNDSMLLAYVAQKAKTDAEPSYGYTIGRKGYPQSDVFPLEGNKVEGVRCTDIFEVYIVGADAGYLISDCVA